MMEAQNIEQSTNDKRRKRQNKKIFLLFLITGITAIVLVATTYAWFVGLGEVTVNTFTVNISSGDQIMLSLDGIEWSDTLEIDQNKIKSSDNGGEAYVGSKNSWVGENGLDPVSSSGDNENGRLTLFSKSSITATGGGYRIMANQIANGTDESDKYVAFDIFIRNGIGDAYVDAYDFASDEAIYLTTDSAVGISPSGAAVGEPYGAANSVRVAFVQIGRVATKNLPSGETPVIECAASVAAGSTYTPLCNQENNLYKTVIWEPNDTAHAASLITYYNRACRIKTTGADEGISYTPDSTCTPLTESGGDTKAVQTYTIKKPILATDKVDVYDGLNEYTATIGEGKSLQATDTFTDTEKLLVDQNRPEFMRLAPNSVTKIRVYVYLEGQDVDNYDLINKDQNVTVTFGFTKDQFDQSN